MKSIGESKTRCPHPRQPTADRQLAVWQAQETELARIRAGHPAPKHLWIEHLGRHFALDTRRRKNQGPCDG